jgi:hypothetical protein
MLLVEIKNIGIEGLNNYHQNFSDKILERNYKFLQPYSLN